MAVLVSFSAHEPARPPASQDAAAATAATPRSTSPRAREHPRLRSIQRRPSLLIPLRLRLLLALKKSQRRLEVPHVLLDKVNDDSTADALALVPCFAAFAM
ncbi:hypothetical protein NLJ89_g3748 [Agrocybe chaxingu]|uniref:Uncharacterized protein n=1 Tax=Agrocybe chaxingu TaxID=84603 RepID=A0A9W8MX46_9AGAR|nr:hypothetical protein NLJ89_g3748 [Agrocybe chaxingu]